MKLVNKFYLLSSVLLFFIIQLRAQKLIPYRSGEKWGYSDNKKNIVLSPIYNEATFFYSNSIACVKKGKKFIYINQKGKKIIRGRYDKASSFNSSYAVVTKNKKQYCIDRKGKKTKCYAHCGGVLNIRTYFKKYSEKGKIGVVVNSYNLGIENIKSPPIWDQLIENHHGFAAVKKDGKWGIINEKLELIVAYQFDSISTTTSNRESGQFRVKLNNKWGMLKGNGDLLLKPTYYKINFFTHNYTKAWISENVWFYIDKKGIEFYKE